LPVALKAYPGCVISNVALTIRLHIDGPSVSLLIDEERSLCRDLCRRVPQVKNPWYKARGRSVLGLDGPQGL
jgi:hypothetical protein